MGRHVATLAQRAGRAHRWVALVALLILVACGGRRPPAAVAAPECEEVARGLSQAPESPPATAGALRDAVAQANADPNTVVRFRGCLPFGDGAVAVEGALNGWMRGWIALPALGVVQHMARLQCSWRQVGVDLPCDSSVNALAGAAANVALSFAVRANPAQWDLAVELPPWANDGADQDFESDRETLRSATRTQLRVVSGEADLDTAVVARGWIERGAIGPTRITPIATAVERIETSRAVDVRRERDADGTWLVRVGAPDAPAPTFRYRTVRQRVEQSKQAPPVPSGWLPGTGRTRLPAMRLATLPLGHASTCEAVHGLGEALVDAVGRAGPGVAASLSVPAFILYERSGDAGWRPARFGLVALAPVEGSDDLETSTLPAGEWSVRLMPDACDAVAAGRVLGDADVRGLGKAQHVLVRLAYGDTDGDPPSVGAVWFR